MRMRPSIIALLALALLAQLSVPWLHAQNWARMQNDGGLSYAFCGKVSAQLLARMKAVAPPDLYPPSTASSTPPSCKLCLVVGALGAMLGSLTVVMVLATMGAAAPAVAGLSAPFRSALRGFDARAPPSLSLL